MSEEPMRYGLEDQDWNLGNHFELGEVLSHVSEPEGKGYVSHFRDFKVWQQGMDLVDRVYALSARFPKEEMYGLVSQVRRAAVSVPSNIAEGWGRNRKGYLALGLSYARGSLHEVETQLEIAVRQGWINREDLVPLNDLLNVSSSGLLRFMQTLEKR
jgi:four helix bundle protein